MKIAIQGHLDRGKEVIQILESLGGINRLNHKGRYTNYFYYVSGDDNTIAWTCVRPQHLNVFTLEEFEKEFPFKIGDKIKHITSIGIIKEYCYVNNEPAYKVEGIESDIIVIIPAKMLEPYKETKEERNITLTLDKAKEWYKKGGELKEIALQAFSEKELTKVDLPKTWKEYTYQNFHREGYVLTHLGDIAETTITGLQGGENLCPSKESAEAHLAMIQLEQLRDCWIQGWVQTPTNPGYRINKTVVGDYIVAPAVSFKYFLAFPTKEMAEEFLKCFRDLIEQARDLI